MRPPPRLASSRPDFVIEILLEHGPESFPFEALVEAAQCGELPRDFLAAFAVREESTDGVMVLAFGHPGRSLRWETFQDGGGFLEVP